MKILDALAKLDSDDGISTRQYERLISKLVFRLNTTLIQEFASCCVQSLDRVAFHKDFATRGIHIVVHCELPPSDGASSQTPPRLNNMVEVHLKEQVKFEVHHVVHLYRDRIDPELDPTQVAMSSLTTGYDLKITSGGGEICRHVHSEVVGDPDLRFIPAGQD